MTEIQDTMKKLGEILQSHEDRLLALETNNPPIEPPIEPPVNLVMRPPPLFNPTIVTDIDALNGKQFSDSEDVLCDFRGKRTTGKTLFKGGHNVRIIGGHFDFAGPEMDSVRGILAFGRQTGTVFVEGVHISGNHYHIDAFQGDGSRDTHYPFTQIFQTCLVEGLGWGTIHGDLIESWPSVQKIVLENFTGRAAGQGIFIPRRKSNDFGKMGPKEVVLRKCHVQVDWEARAASEKMSDFIWLLHLDGQHKAGGVPHDSVILSDVYVDSDDERPFHRRIIPHSSFDGVTVSQDGKSVSFDSKYNFEGVVREGPPPGGTFVTPDMVGVNYDTPWGL